MSHGCSCHPLLSALEASEEKLWVITSARYRYSMRLSLPLLKSDNIAQVLAARGPKVHRNRIQKKNQHYAELTLHAKSFEALPEARCCNSSQPACTLYHLEEMAIQSVQGRKHGQGSSVLFLYFVLL